MTELKDALKVMTALFVMFIAILITPIIASSVGAFSGWIVSFVFNDTIKLITGISGEVWQLGATLGFVSGFFRINTSAINGGKK